jgi:hypothetical protein
LSFLSQVKTGREEKPLYVLIFGLPGTGKTTFACSAPSPIVLGPEEGLGLIDVPRFPKPKSFTEAIEMVRELLTGTHTYQTLVIDSLDWLEPILWKEICDSSQGKHTHIDDFGYGKGYAMAARHWLDLVQLLQQIREKMNVVLIAHSRVRTFQDPTQSTGYDRFEIKLHEKASSLFKESVDAVLFAMYETFVKKEHGALKGKGLGDGARKILTEYRPSHDGKNRLGLPYELPLDWDAFMQAVKVKAGQKPDVLITEITTLAENLDDKLKTMVAKKLKEFGKDAQKLAVLKNKVLAAQGAAA